MPLNQRSMRNLEGVHEDLVRVVLKASERQPFLVTEGLRSKERQAVMVRTGKSQTKNSRHLYGLAVDVCDMDGCYDEPDMRAIARAMKAAAADLDVPIVWGGDWKSFQDTPHFELDRKQYPDSGKLKPWHALKPGDVGKAIGGAGVMAGGAVGTGVTNKLPAFDPVAVLMQSPSLRVGLVATVVGCVFYFVAPKIAERFGWVS